MEKKESVCSCQSQFAFDILTGFKEGKHIDGGCGSSCSRQKNA